MLEHNEPEVSETGTLYSWTGVDVGGAFHASAFVPFNGDSQAILKGSYDDGHGPKIEHKMPLTLLEGLWKFRELTRGGSFKGWK